MLYLASTSPRRAGLLDQHGLAYTCVVPGPEPEASGPPRARAMARAEAKARGARLDGRAIGLVLGADTVVEVAGAELGKPVDRADAARMLCALRGREHDVHTGLYLWAWSPDDRGEDECRNWSCIETARVRCAEFSDAELEAYLDTADWADKAGGYGIQSCAASFMELRGGELGTVIGLPVAALLDLVRAAAAVP